MYVPERQKLPLHSLRRNLPPKGSLCWHFLGILSSGHRVMDLMDWPEHLKTSTTKICDFGNNSELGLPVTPRNLPQKYYKYFFRNNPWWREFTVIYQFSFDYTVWCLSHLKTKGQKNLPIQSFLVVTARSSNLSNVGHLVYRSARP